jgi:hypothetical protein
MSWNEALEHGTKVAKSSVEMSSGSEKSTRGLFLVWLVSSKIHRQTSEESMYIPVLLDVIICKESMVNKSPTRWNGQQRVVLLRKTFLTLQHCLTAESGTTFLRSVLLQIKQHRSVELIVGISGKKTVVVSVCDAVVACEAEDAWDAETNDCDGSIEYWDERETDIWTKPWL